MSLPRLGMAAAVLLAALLITAVSACGTPDTSAQSAPPVRLAPITQTQQPPPAPPDAGTEAAGESSQIVTQDPPSSGSSAAPQGTGAAPPTTSRSGERLSAADTARRFVVLANRAGIDPAARRALRDLATAEVIESAAPPSSATSQAMSQVADVQISISEVAPVGRSSNGLRVTYSRLVKFTDSTSRTDTDIAVNVTIDASGRVTGFSAGAN